MSEIDQFNILKEFKNKIEAGCTNKSFGSLKEDKNNLSKNLKKAHFKNVVTSHRTHSDIILDVQSVSLEAKEGDALITNQKNITLMVKVADCQGVLVYEPKKEVIAAIHSGWKGSAKNIIGKTIQTLVKKYDCQAQNLKIAISPSLGPCCCEFSDPKNELPTFCKPYIKSNNHVDFWMLSKEQCLNEGVKESNIQLPNICTKDNTNYFSHRRQEKGRMAVYIKMK